jgi:Immunoglobulin domain
MKKTLLASVLLTLLAIVPARASQFWYDPITNYALGCISTNNTPGSTMPLWYSHAPGSGLDALVVSNTYTSGAAVSGKRLRINGLNNEYVMRLFDQVNTNAVTSGTLYASFIANANFVPGAGAGTYFATFDDLGSPASATNGFNFRGRVFEIGNTNAYPFTSTTAGTFHYGVANGAGDPAQGGGPSILNVPIDLIKNVDYQVVLKYVVDNGNPAEQATATLWINPASESDTANMVGPTSDAGAVATGLAGLLFRQRTGGGTVDIRDIAVGTTFADVVTNTTPGPVLVATNYQTVSTYSGNPALLEVFATSIGGGVFKYQWYKIAGGITNAVAGANAQTMLINSLTASDQGNYFCAITNAGGLSALSGTNFAITVNATPTAPSFTVQPKSTGASVGGSLTLTCTAVGTGPLGYQWFFNNNPLADGAAVTGLPGDLSVVSGSQTPSLTITGLSTNETGNYKVTVTSGAAVTPNSATSTNALVTVNPPKGVSIAFLRSLENTSTWQPTDTTSTYAITGVVTTHTNLTSGTTSSYFIQDATAGIDLFITGDATFRPIQGDVVTASGTLSMFNNALEMAVNASNPYQGYHILSNNIAALPAPYVFNVLGTNNAPLMETNVEGRLVMLTNVFFPTSGGAVFGSGANVIVTNQSGAPFIVFVSAQIADVIGQPMPKFAYSVLGAVTQFKSGTYSSAGYELNLTSLSDIITNPPPATTASATLVGQTVVLSWTAVPYNYSYSVLSAPSVTGPWTPLVSGMTFTNPSASYTDTLTGSAKFYRIATP